MLNWCSNRSYQITAKWKCVVNMLPLGGKALCSRSLLVHLTTSWNSCTGLRAIFHRTGDILGKQRHISVNHLDQGMFLVEKYWGFNRWLVLIGMYTKKPVQRLSCGEESIRVGTSAEAYLGTLVQCHTCIVGILLALDSWQPPAPPDDRENSLPHEKMAGAWS